MTAQVTVKGKVQEVIQEWCEERSGVPENGFVRRLKDFLTEEQVAKTLKVMDEVCNICWNGTNKCQCWER